MSRETNHEALNAAIESLEEVDFDSLKKGHKEAFLRAHGTLMALSTELEEDDQ